MRCEGGVRKCDATLAREGALDNHGPALCAGLGSADDFCGRGGGRHKVSRGASIL